VVSTKNFVAITLKVTGTSKNRIVSGKMIGTEIQEKNHNDGERKGKRQEWELKCWTKVLKIQFDIVRLVARQSLPKK
jgi:hypothetical protein